MWQGEGTDVRGVAVPWVSQPCKTLPEESSLFFLLPKTIFSFHNLCSPRWDMPVALVPGLINVYNPIFPIPQVLMMMIIHTAFKTILQGIQSLLMLLQIPSKQEGQVLELCLYMESICPYQHHSHLSRSVWLWEVSCQFKCSVTQSPLMSSESALSHFALNLPIATWTRSRRHTIARTAIRVYT